MKVKTEYLVKALQHIDKNFQKGGKVDIFIDTATKHLVLTGFSNSDNALTIRIPCDDLPLYVKISEEKNL